MALSWNKNERKILMSNMSYCRFTNTSGDLSDCLNALREDKHLSDFEVSAGISMFKEFLAFCIDYDIVEGYDALAIESMFEELKRGDSND